MSTIYNRPTLFYRNQSMRCYGLQLLNIRFCKIFELCQCLLHGRPYNGRCSMLMDNNNNLTIRMIMVADYDLHISNFLKSNHHLHCHDITEIFLKMALDIINKQIN